MFRALRYYHHCDHPQQMIVSAVKFYTNMQALEKVRLTL
jgi:hypothetical protein